MLVASTIQYGRESSRFFSFIIRDRAKTYEAYKFLINILYLATGRSEDTGVRCKHIMPCQPALCITQAMEE